MRALLLLVGLHGLVAGAATRELVAAHPLVIVGGEQADEALHTAFAAEVARLNVDLVDSEQVRAFLKTQRNESCVGDDRCLAELARATRASRALLVTILPHAPRVIVSGKIVLPAGRVLKVLSGREYPRGKDHLESAKQAMRKFLAELDPAQVELAPLESPKEPEPQLAVVAPPPSTVAPGAPSLRTASYVALGVGGAALLASAAVAVSAQSEVQQTQQMLGPNGGILAEKLDEGLERHRSLERKSAMATALLVASGASAAAAGVLYYLSLPTSPALALGPGGGAVAVRGTFW